MAVSENLILMLLIEFGVCGCVMRIELRESRPSHSLCAWLHGTSEMDSTLEKSCAAQEMQTEINAFNLL